MNCYITTVFRMLYTKKYIQCHYYNTLHICWAEIKEYCIVLYCIALYCIVLYCIVLYCIVLYCIVLYCIVLYCIVLYCIVLYCIVLYKVHRCAFGPDAELQTTHEEVAAKVTLYWMSHWYNLGVLCYNITKLHTSPGLLCCQCHIDNICVSQANSRVSAPSPNRD